MPFDFELEESTRIVMSRAWGDLADADLLSHLQRIKMEFERGTLDAKWAQIADFSRVENLDHVTSEGILEMAARNPWPEESLRVLVVPSDVKYGLGRMYQMLGDRKTACLVLARSVGEAKQRIESARGGSAGAT